MATKRVECVASYPGATTFTVTVDGKAKGEIEHLGEGCWSAASYGSNHRAEDATYSNKRKAAEALAKGR